MCDNYAPHSLCYAHENGIVLVDIIQKCIIMNATLSDLYGGTNMTNNRDISIQPFATSSVLQHHYQSTGCALSQQQPQAIGGGVLENPFKSVGVGGNHNNGSSSSSSSGKPLMRGVLGTGSHDSNSSELHTTSNLDGASTQIDNTSALHKSGAATSALSFNGPGGNAANTQVSLFETLL